MTRPPTIAMAAGGTGGHMFAAQSLGEALLAHGWRVLLFTDVRGKRFTGDFAAGIDLTTIPSAPLTSGGPLTKVRALGQIIRGIAATTRQMRRDCPSVVVGFGGYPSFPTLVAAWLLRRPMIIHEQNGVLGRVNRLFARRVSAVACGVWPTSLPRGVSGVDVGNPVRQSILERAGAPYTAPSATHQNVLIFGGSQGASILSRAVPEALEHIEPGLRASLRIVQQARAEDVSAVQQRYVRMGVEARVVTFIEDMAEQLCRAQLVISRSGASSVSEIATIGRPAILIPFARATNDHQTANARHLQNAGAARVIGEQELTGTALAKHITSIMGDPAQAETMAASARAHGREDATDRLVKLAQQVAR